MGLRMNLSVMMFLQFAVWGAWFVVLGNYAGALGFPDALIGSIYATMPLGSMLSPIFVGQIADRYFSSERLMAVLHLAGAAILYWMATITDGNTFYWAALLYALVYSPTLALANSIAFTHLPDATRDFPGVRVLGTLGWIAAGLLVTALLGTFAIGQGAGVIAPEFSIMMGGSRLTLPLVLAAAFSLILGIQSFMLPHTPPLGKPGEALPFLRAIGLLREFSFAVFYGVSFIITIALAFYYAWTSPFLQQSQGVDPANLSSVMAIGQFAELLILPFLPWFLRNLGMKWVLALGMLSWGIRYAFFSLGSPFALVLIGVALHGICFDFFLAAGFIHVDNESPREIRASAQALFGFLTYGAGMFIGSEISGRLKEAYTVDGVMDWRGFWLVPAVGVLISLVLFVVLFRGPMKKTEPAESVAEPATV
jgi:nucleoside transporter